MLKTTISDTRIKLRPSKKLIQLIYDNKDSIKEIPEGIVKILQHCGYNLTSKVELIKDEGDIRLPQIDIELLKRLCKEAKEPEKDETKPKTIETKENVKNDDTSEVFLHLREINWLNDFLKKLRKEQGLNVYLHNLLQSCELELPENDVIKRNPELEARCQKLREEQQNRDYLKMTKNVDSSLKNYPEDTIAYQMKALNSQIIAVLQFVFSVVAGFVFGFLGIQLIIGDLDFGLRLLLGIMFALIIALAEIYFLAKKLNEYDNAVTSFPTGSPNKNRKVHTD